MSVSFGALYLARNLSAAIRAALSGDSRRALPGGASPRILRLILHSLTHFSLPWNLRRWMSVRMARKVVLYDESCFLLI